MLCQGLRGRWLGELRGGLGMVGGVDEFTCVFSFFLFLFFSFVCVEEEGTFLADGFCDVCQAAIRCFGPTESAARMEGSKTFAKDFMARWNIPTAEYRNFRDYESAKSYLDGVDHRVVIKASGLYVFPLPLIADIVSKQTWIFAPEATR